LCEKTHPATPAPPRTLREIPFARNPFCALCSFASFARKPTRRPLLLRARCEKSPLREIPFARFAPLRPLRENPPGDPCSSAHAARNPLCEKSLLRALLLCVL